MDFQAFVQDIRQNQWPVFGVQVYERGALYGQYGDVQERHPIYSCTKTLLALAIGIAADEGRMDVEKPVLSYLPAKAIRAMHEQQKAVYASLPVARLMCMSVAGYPFRLKGEGSWLQETLAYPVSAERSFDYSNVSAYLAGVAATEAIGEDVYGYLCRKVLAPLHIFNVSCQRCPEGYFYGATGMALSVEELSRIGALLYQQGVYEGKQLISRRFLSQMTAVQQPTKEGGYGYFLWKYRDGSSINGKWGQKCYILPGEGKMITFLSHWEEDTLPLKQSMERNLL